MKRWLFRNQLNPVAELDGNGMITSRFVYGTKDNVPDFMVRSGVTYRVLSDHIGSPRAIVDIATAGVVWRADYDAWGNRTLIMGAADFIPFGFAGGLLDHETGLLRFGAREYDPRIGRWLAKDPIGWIGRQWNLYAYVGNDPVNKEDATGLYPPAYCIDKCEDEYYTGLAWCTATVGGPMLCWGVCSKVPVPQMGACFGSCIEIVVATAGACTLGMAAEFAVCMNKCPEDIPEDYPGMNNSWLDDFDPSETCPL